MAIQLQVRNRFGGGFTGNNWMCDGETNRKEPTKFMKETALRYRREQPDYEVRFVREEKDFVK